MNCVIVSLEIAGEVLYFIAQKLPDGSYQAQRAFLDKADAEIAIEEVLE